jgi:transcription termination/antitermination protein NusA
MVVKLGMKDLLLVNSFETLTGATVMDMFEEGKNLIFIVPQGQVGKAVGKSGKHVKLLSRKLKKEVKVIEHNKDRIEFIKNLIFPVRPKNVYDEEEDIVVIEVQDTKSKGLLIGRNASNLRSLEETVRRHHNIKEIKIR